MYEQQGNQCDLRERCEENINDREQNLGGNTNCCHRALEVIIRTLAFPLCEMGAIGEF